MIKTLTPWNPTEPLKEFFLLHSFPESSVADSETIRDLSKYSVMVAGGLWGEFMMLTTLGELVL